ncbi:hypothetical protein EV122DRAFT_211674, partial [Schizophyllum commune]
MFKVGKKYGVRILAPQPTPDLQSQLPIWYPIGQDPSKQRRYTSKESECLRTKHRVLTAGDARLLAQLLDNPRHKPRRNCKCNECWIIKQHTQCANPHKCATEADKLLDNLEKKWDPRTEIKVVRPLTKRELRHNEHAKKKGGPIFFNPAFEAHKTISDNFRIFTEEDSPQSERPLRAR